MTQIKLEILHKTTDLLSLFLYFLSSFFNFFLLSMLIVCMNSSVRFFISNILLPSAIHSQPYIVHFTTPLQSICSSTKEQNMSCDVEGRLNIRCNSRLGPFKAQWLLYVQTVLTSTNSTFCPQSVFMCFVWISEKQQLFHYTEMTSLLR